MSNIVIQTQAFAASQNSSKKCVGCGESTKMQNFGRRGTGPSKGGEEKETCQYDCYRIVWQVKNMLRELQDEGSPAGIFMVKKIIEMIESGTPAIRIKPVLKHYKKNPKAFKRQYKLIRKFGLDYQGAAN